MWWASVGELSGFTAVVRLQTRELFALHQLRLHSAFTALTHELSASVLAALRCTDARGARISPSTIPILTCGTPFRAGRYACVPIVNMHGLPFAMAISSLGMAWQTTRLFVSCLPDVCSGVKPIKPWWTIAAISHVIWGKRQHAAPLLTNFDRYHRIRQSRDAAL